MGTLVSRVFTRDSIPAKTLAGSRSKWRAWRTRSGRIDGTEPGFLGADEEIAEDWVAAYKKYVGARKTSNPQQRCSL